MKRVFGCRAMASRHLCRAVGALLAGWMLSAPALSSPASANELTIDKSYYSIGGDSLAELSASIRRNAPRSGGAYGIGFIDFHPDFETVARNGKCRIEKARVDVRIALRLPRWRETVNGPAAVRRFAGRFVNFVEAHEMQHVAIARRFAGRMSAVLARLPADASCWNLRTRARAIIGRLKAEHLTAQRIFDDRTRSQIKAMKTRLAGFAVEPASKSKAQDVRRRH